MTEELLYFNGVNGDTGSYDLYPMTAQQLFDAWRGVAEPENIKELAYRVQWETEKHLGVIYGVDPNNLEEAGWGVIFPADLDGKFVSAVKEALQPLLKLRQEQAGERFQIYEGSRGLDPDESKTDYLSRLGVPPADPANPEIMPYYLLLVGNPEQISYRFQSQLDVQYAVGRIYFDTLEEYANYARSVVAAETGADTGNVQLAREAAFFGVANPDDGSTFLSHSALMKPLYETFEKRKDWHIEPYLGDKATKAQLTQLLTGNKPPALLFTACHGVDFAPGSSRQLPHQGALLCQDWPGPSAWSNRGPIPQDHYFAADDLTADTNLLGSIAFFFACFSGGTPTHDEYPFANAITPRKIAERPFIARLPMRMLGLPRGGALATIAHVDRTWGSSFQWGAAKVKQTAVFESLLKHLMDGLPVGSALEYFNSRYATWASELSTTLRDVKFGLQVEPTNITSMWTAHNDARGFAILGDPAVRLPLQKNGDAAATRMAFTEPVTVDTKQASAYNALIAASAATDTSAVGTATSSTTPADTLSFGGQSTELPIAAPEDFAIRIDFPAAPDGDVSFGLTDTIEERSRSAIRAAMNTIQEMAMQTDLMRKGIPGGSQPRMIKIKFGINLDFQAGALIARSGVGATMEIELEWARRSDDVLRVLRAETDVASALKTEAD